MRTHLWERSLVILLIASWLGCGGSGKPEVEKRYGAKGIVTLDGAPLAQGEIVFESPEDLTAGIPPGIGKIENGRYEATISTGKKVVRISSLVPAGEPDPTGLVPTKETLPAKYNTESQLEAVVTESAENKFDFDLVSDKDDVAE